MLFRIALHFPVFSSSSVFCFFFRFIFTLLVILHTFYHLTVLHHNFPSIPSHLFFNLTRTSISSFKFHRRYISTRAAPLFFRQENVFLLEANSKQLKPPHQSFLTDSSKHFVCYRPPPFHQSTPLSSQLKLNCNY